MTIPSQIKVVTTTLPLDHGGRTKSLLQRASIFANHGISTKIFTTNYNPNYSDVYDHLKDKGSLDQQISACNINDYYSESLGTVKDNHREFIDSDQTNPFIANCLEDMYERRVIYNSDTGKVKRYDYLNAGTKKRKIRAYLNSKGNVHRLRYYDLQNNKPEKDLFLNDRLQQYQSRYYCYVDGEREISSIHLYSKGEQKASFKRLSDFHAFWFDEVMKEDDTVICDARPLDEPLMQVRHGITRIFQLHSSHLCDSDISGVKIRDIFEYLLSCDLGEKDHIVTLTHAQRNDIEDEFPHLKKHLHVIAHSIKLQKISEAVVPRQLCVVARLVPEKGIEDAIMAFSLFVKRRPHYSLLIYGDGEELAKLKRLVDELDLSEKVSFEGYINEPELAFERAEFSLITSSFEGFSLSALESIAGGCPVVSYDIKYGPSEILDVSCGRLTKDNNPKALFKEMKKEARRPKSRNAARLRAGMFCEKNFFLAWSKLLET